MLGSTLVFGLFSIVLASIETSVDETSLYMDSSVDEWRHKRLFLLPNTVYGRAGRDVKMASSEEVEELNDSDETPPITSKNAPLRRRESMSAPLRRTLGGRPRGSTQRSRQCYFTPVQCVLYVPNDQYEQLVKAVPYPSGNTNQQPTNNGPRPRPKNDASSRKRQTTKEMLQQWRQAEAAPMLRGFLRKQRPIGSAYIGSNAFLSRA